MDALFAVVAALALFAAAWASARLAASHERCAELNRLVESMLIAGVTPRAARLAAEYAERRRRERD